MATTTTNLGLTKPAQTDFYDVDVFNGNADLIDTAVGQAASSTQVEQIEEDVETISADIGGTADAAGSVTTGSVFAKLNKIIGDITTHMGRWTAARATKIDTIETNTAKASHANGTTGTAAYWALAAYNMGVNTKTNTETNNTASKTGILSQKHAYTHSLLENTTYGLSAIKTAVNGISTSELRPSLTGTGKTVYTQTSQMPIGTMRQSYLCIAKFIAPVDGAYNYSLTIKNNTNSSSSPSDIILYRPIISFRDDDSMIGLDEIYDLATISHSYNTNISDINVIKIKHLDDTVISANSSKSYSGTFFCTAGEPMCVFLWVTQINLILTALTITYQAR